jgi:hypothetical protein
MIKDRYSSKPQPAISVSSFTPIVGTGIPVYPIKISS